MYIVVSEPDDLLKFKGLCKVVVYDYDARVERRSFVGCAARGVSSEQAPSIEGVVRHAFALGLEACRQDMQRSLTRVCLTVEDAHEKVPC